MFILQYSQAQLSTYMYESFKSAIAHTETYVPGTAEMDLRPGADLLRCSPDDVSPSHNHAIEKLTYMYFRPFFPVAKFK